jgi:hypothetical protein
MAPSSDVATGVRVDVEANVPVARRHRPWRRARGLDPRHGPPAHSLLTPSRSISPPPPIAARPPPPPPHTTAAAQRRLPMPRQPPRPPAHVVASSSAAPRRAARHAAPHARCPTPSRLPTPRPLREAVPHRGPLHCCAVLQAQRPHRRDVLQPAALAVKPLVPTADPPPHGNGFT